MLGSLGNTPVQFWAVFSLAVDQYWLIPPLFLHFSTQNGACLSSDVIRNFFPFFLKCILLSITFRASYLLATLLHEWSHLSIGLIWKRPESIISIPNIFGNVDPKLWFTCLNPLQPLPENFKPHVVITSREDGCDSQVCGLQSYFSSERVIEVVGWLSSLILWLLSLWTRFGFEHSTSDISWTIQNGFFCALIGATVTDLISSEKSHRKHFFCGNFGLIVLNGVSTAKKQLVDVWSVLESMAAISTQRGGQSGGIVTFLSSKGSGAQGVRRRVCPSKRQSLPSLLRNRFQFGVSMVNLWARLVEFFRGIFRRFTGRKPLNNVSSVNLFIGHTRFATSSIPSASETHPHQWTSEKVYDFWEFDPHSGKLVSSKKRFGLYITHNGDFEFWNLFGRDRTHSEIGNWLTQVLGCPQPAACDSAMIAGLMELLRTQGLWINSFRLAFQQVVVMTYEEVVSPLLGAPTGAPSEKELSILGNTAEKAFRDFVSKVEPQLEASDYQNLRKFLPESDIISFVEILITTLKNMEEETVVDDLPDSTLTQFLVQSVTNFLDNDMFWAVKKFMEHAKGSYGMAAGSTLDLDKVVLAALNQPISMGISPENKAVVYSSESQALKVPLRKVGTTSGSSEGHVALRFDLDEDEGEIVEIKLMDLKEVEEKSSGDLENGVSEGKSLLNSGDSFKLEKAPFVEFRIHNRKMNAPVRMEEIIESGRLVGLEENPYITLIKPVAKSKDIVGEDIKDIPNVLEQIRRDWSTDESLNKLTADAFFEMIKEKAVQMHNQGSDEAHNRREIDVLVVGVENSLWVGEQFAADLQNLLPQLRVVPISANKVIGVMGNARGAISTAGFSFCRISTLLTPSSVVLCISQSGQTFPTLHATRILSKHCTNRVFVCSGMMDSKMGSAVGQEFHREAEWKRRIFHTHAGWREAEAASVAVVSCHATLTELMLFMAAKFRYSVRGVPSPLGLRLSANDIDDLQRIRYASTYHSIKAIIEPSEVSSHLKNRGFKWALHVLETPMAWILSAAYIFGTVIFGVPVFTDLRRWIFHDSGVASYLAHALDSAVYLFLPLIFALLLRVITGRQLLARIGQRTIVIADVPYVHQLLESYVSKMFSLSYWIAGVEVHGSNPIDHFVHRFTHRVKRGLLLAVGRPDGRLCSQTKCESWVLMAVMQARSIISLRTGAEVLTVGHNPYQSSVIDSHVVLPSLRPKFLCEKLLGVEEFEPMKRMANRKHVVSKSTGSDAIFDELDNQVVGSHYYLSLEGSLRKARKQGLQMFSHGRSEVEEEEMDDPDARGRAISAMDLDVQKLLDSQAAMEEITENRFLSLERLIAFYVLFHKMASTVASFWPLRFDTWRSQSGLRIATTAAPVSAADLEREWMDSLEDRDITIHRRRGASGSNSRHSLADLWTGGSTRGASPGGSLRGIGGSLRGNALGGTGVLRFLGKTRSTTGESFRNEGSTHRGRRVANYGDSTRGGGTVRGGMGGIGDSTVVVLKGFVSGRGKGPEEDVAKMDGESSRDSSLQQQDERVKGGESLLRFLKNGSI